MINELQKKFILKEYKIKKSQFNYDTTKIKLDKKIKALIVKISKTNKNCKIDFKEIFVNDIPKMIPSKNKKEIENELSNYLNILEYKKTDQDINMIYKIIKNGLDVNLTKIISSFYLYIENKFKKPYFLLSEIKISKEETNKLFSEIIKNGDFLNVFTENIDLLEYNDYNKANLNLILDVLISSYNLYLKIKKKKIKTNPEKQVNKIIKFYKDDKNNDCFEIINEHKNDEYKIENVGSSLNTEKLINNNKNENKITINMINKDYNEIIKNNKDANLQEKKANKLKSDNIINKLGNKYLFKNEENLNDIKKAKFINKEDELKNLMKELENYKKIYNLVYNESKKCIQNYKILKQNQNEINQICDIYMESIDDKNDYNWKQIYEIKTLKLNKLLRYKLILAYFLENFTNDITNITKKFKNENKIENDNNKINFDLNELISKPGLILNKKNKTEKEISNEEYLEKLI